MPQHTTSDADSSISLASFIKGQVDTRIVSVARSTSCPSSTVVTSLVSHTANNCVQLLKTLRDYINRKCPRCSLHIRGIKLGSRMGNPRHALGAFNSPLHGQVLSGRPRHQIDFCTACHGCRVKGSDFLLNLTHSSNSLHRSQSTPSERPSVMVTRQSSQPSESTQM